MSARLFPPILVPPRVENLNSSGQFLGVLTRVLAGLPVPEPINADLKVPQYQHVKIPECQTSSREGD